MFILSITILPIFQNCGGGFQLRESLNASSFSSLPNEGLQGLRNEAADTTTPYQAASYEYRYADDLILNVRNKQVFQRQSSVNLNGSVYDNAVIVPLKFKKASANIRWVTVVVKSPSATLIDRTYSTTDSASELQLPFALRAGGWYLLELTQVDDSQRTMYKSRVSAFGVGDIYLIAGQSNAAQHAEVKTAAKSSLVVMTDPETHTWAQAADPLPYATVTPTRMLNGKGQGSNWPELGDYLVQSQGVPVAFLNTAIGGTSVSQWQPGAAPFNSGASIDWVYKDYYPYTRLLFAAKYLLEKSGGFKMILWHQGEADLYENECEPSSLGTCAPVLYTARFMQLKNSLDTDLGMNLKWVVARTTFSREVETPNCIGITQTKPFNSQLLRASQQALWGMNNIYQGPESDDLKEGYRYPGEVGACVHFSYAGQKEMAKRWFNAINASLSQTANSSRFVNFTNRTGNISCRIGELCLSRTGGQAVTIYYPNGTVALTKRCNGPWALDFTADHFTNLCNGLTTTQATLNQPNHWQLITNGDSSSNSSSAPPPDPQIISQGTGCSDNLCLWVIVTALTADYEVYVRDPQNYAYAPRITAQDLLLVRSREDGTKAVSFKIPMAALAVYRARGLDVILVNKLNNQKRSWARYFPRP
ncbi:sialate O-acetylesterase [Bdellovibrio sp. 22V]|uniref:sialate O-acetylesterase n=1 Tax=Bdellovibrio sp. 22V TaxID=3044166 RepID=UPI0025433FD0|nr:sialate O-acetylesterase [Bdellovibrio sp. 22V]WII73412.1 sialate O-acetylesterase [Bdellovibrio sp. 22V]